MARDLQFGYEIGHDEGIGEDEYVLEKNVDEYNEIGIVNPASTMTRTVKKKYAKDWIHINNEMLQEGGLGIQMIGDSISEFCAGVFFSMSYSTSVVAHLQFSMSYSSSVVPHLQDVFQADAAHMNFGKYTLFSCYGSTANANTSPIAFAGRKMTLTRSSLKQPSI